MSPFCHLKDHALPQTAHRLGHSQLEHILIRLCTFTQQSCPKFLCVFRDVEFICSETRILAFNLEAAVLGFICENMRYGRSPNNAVEKQVEGFSKTPRRTVVAAALSTALFLRDLLCGLELCQND